MTLWQPDEDTARWDRGRARTVSGRQASGGVGAGLQPCIL